MGTEEARIRCHLCKKNRMKRFMLSQQIGVGFGGAGTGFNLSLCKSCARTKTVLDLLDVVDDLYMGLRADYGFAT